MLIYHYTTISGLIGIISKCELWASDCRYLNDGSELSYASGLFWDEVKKLNLREIGECEDGFYVLPGSAQELFCIFITCFCRNGDLLSQWRGYGENQGYSLGFSLAFLKRTPEVDDIIPIKYGITNPSRYFNEELESAQNISAHPAISNYHASKSFLPKIASVKHPGFTEEKEYRILKQLEVYDVNKSDSKIKFRPSSNGPIPYLSLPFKINCLKEIIIGPGENIESRENSVRELLDHYQFNKVKIRRSKIPYRQ